MMSCAKHSLRGSGVLKHIKRKEFVAMAIAIAALWLFKWGYLPGKESYRERGGLPVYAHSSLEDISVISIENLKTLWSASSKKAILSADGSRARLEEVSLRIPAEELSLKAAGGVLNLDDTTLDLKGQVTTQIKGFQVKTDSLRITPGGKVDSGEKVVLEKESIIIEGGGLEAGDKKNVKVKNNVKATFY